MPMLTGHPGVDQWTLRSAPLNDTLMNEAKKEGWIVISMKDHWKTIFPPEQVSH